MSDDFDSGDSSNTIMHGQRYGEQKLIVFTAVECAGRHIHIHLLCQTGGLIVQGDAFFVDATACVALLTNMKQFATETIADVHHGSWVDTFFGQCFNNVLARLWFQLTLQKVFSSCKIRLKFFERFCSIGIIFNF